MIGRSLHELHAIPRHPHQHQVGMLPVFTTTLWLVFAAAGVAGLRIHYPQFATAPKVRPPVAVERLNVNVVKTEPRASPKTAITQRQAVPEPQPVTAPPLPSLLPVAGPRLNIPFPLAVKGPFKIAEPGKAVPTPANSTQVQHLTLGQGEGDQPPPQYPREARLAHQEGNVIVQMTIAENGDVTDAKVTSPSPWPILNQAALRAVRDTWHFEKGPVRYKDIEFVFELHQR